MADGAEFLEAPTRQLKPSQRCPGCGRLRKKTLSERRHECDCGCSLGRDQAAARVLLQWGLEQERRLQEHALGTITPAGTVGVSAAQAA
ncbi:putative transposase-like DNA-binding protein [Rhodovulum bhavnagarense]|uniref:Putative transposase-like DNA-binding protein n=1 Tax=Rhodovulum bhavnagarense TaxID=992286 RepID=A0A4R2R5W2_9RHOB|nr:zinc ribbon domain-containing protein [Rhodovulum bhavnagarense]TCP58382.1 putative transposase-like DNA-binding protein [Rhodovulum bhavnagarense]